MPTITFSLKDLNNLIGKKTDEKTLRELLTYCKAEIESVEGDEVSIKLNDTNLPYLWSVEGIAALLRGVLKKETGIPKAKIKQAPQKKLIVDQSIIPIRPHITAFLVKGPPLTEYLLKQLVQLQEKLSENYGRKREKVAIGLYPAEKIKFPVTYKAAPPETTFVPLDFNRKLTLTQILQQHPKGKTYAHLLEGKKKYPLLTDSQEQVLSFPPVINSANLGKLEVGTKEIFFEATGSELEQLQLAANIFILAFAQRGYEIQTFPITHPQKKTAEYWKTQQHKLDTKEAEKILGITLSQNTAATLLKQARYDVKGNTVIVPPYRQDIMHARDIIEDIAIIYGYNKLEPMQLTTHTTGGTTTTQKFIDQLRELATGLGYQEIFSAVLSNKEVVFKNTGAKEDAVEIENPTSQTYSIIRSWLTPILLEFLAQNKHTAYPQKIFEQGPVTKKTNNKAQDSESIAFATSHSKANYTETKQAADYILKQLAAEYTMEEYDHPSFIEGRGAQIKCRGVAVGFLGEISPKVLISFGLEMPVAVLEINVTELLQAPRR